MGGVFHRPYQLGQGADSTTTACIDTLYHHFCRARNLDPEMLYSKAYHKRAEPGSDERVTREFAEWQGLTYPKHWSDQEVLKLLHDLTSINNHRLVASIIEALPTLQERFYPVKRHRVSGKGKKGI